MVKVLERGNAVKATMPLRPRCGGCRSLLEFTRAEARYEPDFLDGAALVVECPVCGHDVWVEIPSERPA